MIVDPGFSTPAVSAALSPQARVAAMCRFEAALARASADAGVVPDDAATRIADACAVAVDDADAVLSEGWEVGTPVLPLLARLRGRLDETAASWLHHGATTQDVVDTAMILTCRDALPSMTDDAQRAAEVLRDLAVAHRDRPVVGRTLLQPAAPTTLGWRLATWMAPVSSAADTLAATASDLPVQLGGPVGDLARLGASGPQVVRGVAALLGLRAGPAWHADRTPVVRLLDAVRDGARAAATVGAGVAVLAQPEIGELRARAGGSSAMPHKRNPVDAVHAVAAAQVCAAVASAVGARPIELERGIGGWRAEDAAVPLAVASGAAALTALRRIAETLEVDVEAVAANVERLGPPRPAQVAAAAAAVDELVAAHDARSARTAGGRGPARNRSGDERR